MLTCSKCRAGVARDDAHIQPVFGLNRAPRVYCPKCWRKVEWARTHQRGLDPRRVRAWEREASRGSAEERANARYWEREANYRERGAGWEYSE